MQIICQFSRRQISHYHRRALSPHGSHVPPQHLPILQMFKVVLVSYPIPHQHHPYPSGRPNHPGWSCKAHILFPFNKTHAMIQMLSKSLSAPSSQSVPLLLDNALKSLGGGREVEEGWKVVGGRVKGGLIFTGRVEVVHHPAFRCNMQIFPICAIGVGSEGCTPGTGQGDDGCPSFAALQRIQRDGGKWKGIDLSFRKCWRGFEDKVFCQVQVYK